MKNEDLNDLETYGKICDEVQQIFRSRLQTSMLLSLIGHNKTLSQLREITGSSSQALIPKIRKLEALYLIQEQDHEYQLTPLGGVIASKFADFSRALESINVHKNFWMNHYLEKIPAQFLNEIGDLSNSQIMSDTNVNIFNVYANYLRIIKEAGHVYGISSIMSPGHSEAIAQRIVEGITVELIVSRGVAMQLKEEPYASQINALANFKNFRVMVSEAPLKLGITVTDKCLSLGLFKTDGVTYDTTTDLFSFDPRAIAWGTRLFGYYKQRSEILEIGNK